MTYEPNVTKSHPMFNMETKLTTWTETRHCIGYDMVREVIATEWVETNRTNCFCCSCDDIGASDPYCRNHGFAGSRPCETHKMEGYIDPYYDPERNVMHDSVQEVWRKRGSSKTEDR